MKKIFILVFALLLAAACTACATTTPSPTPLPPTTTIPGGLPPVGTDNMLSPSPDVNTPGINEGDTATPGTNGSGVNGNGANTPGSNNMTTIPDFKEGTKVKHGDLPDITNAFKERYADFTLSDISHGLYENEQVYVIEYKDAAGAMQKAYIRPNATWVDTNAITP